MGNTLKTLICIVTLQHNAIDQAFWNKKQDIWFKKIEATEKTPGKKKRKLKENKQEFLIQFNQSSKAHGKDPHSINNLNTYSYHVVSYAAEICQITLALEAKIEIISMFAPVAIKILTDALIDEAAKEAAKNESDTTKTEGIPSSVINQLFKDVYSKITTEMKLSKLKIKSDKLLKAIITLTLVNKLNTTASYIDLLTFLNTSINTVLQRNITVLKNKILTAKPTIEQLSTYMKYKRSQFDHALEPLKTLSDPAIQTCVELAKKDKTLSNIIDNFNTLNPTDAKLYKFKHNEKHYLVCIYMPDSSFQKAQIVSDTEISNMIFNVFSLNSKYESTTAHKRFI